MVFAIFIVLLLAVTVVNAADNDTADVVSVDVATDDVVNLDQTNDVVDEGKISNENVNDNLELNDFDSSFETLNKSDEVSDSSDDEVLSYVNNDDLLSASPPYNKYSVSVSDTTINYASGGNIVISVTPCSGYSYKYDFYLKVYDSGNNEKISKNYYSATSTTKITHTISANQLNPGSYTIKLINYADKEVMSTAKLTVNSNLPSSAYSVSVSDTSIKYGSGGSIVMSISSASSSYGYRYDFYLKVYDSDNVEKISQRYYSTSSASSKTYSVGSTQLSPGVYTIKIINNYDDVVMDTARLTVTSVPSSAYSVSVSDTSIKYGSDGSIVMSISPASSSYYYKYDFYLKVYDSDNVEKISQRYYSTNFASSKTYTISSDKLARGIYIIKIINNYDNVVMDTAKLTVKNINVQTKNLAVKYNDIIQYKVRVSEDGLYKSGLKVTFSCNNIKKTVNTDSNGYATLKIHLKAGTYKISTKCGIVVKENTIKINPTYVANKYRLVYIKPVKTYYGVKNKFKYSWKGNIKGFFKIYKGKKVVYSQKLDTSGKVGDYFKYKSHAKSYSIKKLPVGSYFAKIIDSTGKIAKRQTIKIYKSQTRVLCASFKSTVGSNVGINVKVYGKANDNAVGFVKFMINGKVYSAKLKSGFAKIKIQLPFSPKTYYCNVKYLGNKYYKPSSKSFNMLVIKPKTKIFTESFKSRVGTERTLTIYLENTYTDSAVKNAAVKIVVAGETYWADVYDGVAKITIKMPSEPGTYYGSVKFEGNAYMSGSSYTFKMDVIPPSEYIVISAPAESYFIYTDYGIYTVETKIWEMYSGILGYFRYIDVFLYKHGEMVPNYEYQVDYCVDGEWTGWTQYIQSTSHHRHAVPYSVTSAEVKVRVHR